MDIVGTEFEDILRGDASADSLEGLAGNDTISGSGGDDTISGGAGNDDITGGHGDDSMSGGLGDDVFYLGVAKGHDTILGGGGTDAVLLREPTILDTADYYEFGVLDGVEILAIPFNSEITVRVDGLFDVSSVETVLHTNLTNRWLFIEASSGDDTIKGFSISNAEESAGPDRLYGGDGNDVIYGYHGSDGLYGENGDDSLFGGRGGDGLHGGEGNDLLRGNRGHDSLRPGAGENTLYGGSGDDAFYAGDGTDEMHGGKGFDTIHFDWAEVAEGVSVDFNNQESNTGIAAGDVYTGIEKMSGTDFDDVLKADEADNTLLGSEGSDELYGRAGRDLLVGRWGQDTLFGGTDADKLKGGNDKDELYGKSGDDTLIGGSGNDLLEGGTGSDTFIHRNNTGRDAITDFELGATSVDRIDLSDFRFASFDALEKTFSTIGSDTLISMDSSDSILLRDVAMEDLTADHFLL
ncbi:MAG: calcium-binding protein [Pseudomonadota bacterium]